MTFTYRLNKEQLQDYRENNINVNDILEELIEDILDEYIMTGDKEVKIYLTKYMGHNFKLNEDYEKDIDTIYYTIDELVEYMTVDMILESLHEVVLNNLNYKIKLNEVLAKLKGIKK